MLFFVCKLAILRTVHPPLHVFVLVVVCIFLIAGTEKVGIAKLVDLHFCSRRHQSVRWREIEKKRVWDMLA